MVDFGHLSLKYTVLVWVVRKSSVHIRSWPQILNSAADSCKTYFDTSSKAFSRSMMILAERDLYLVLNAFKEAASEA